MKLMPPVVLALLAGTLLSTCANAAEAPSQSLDPITRQHLAAAMHGEAFAQLKYLRYAEQARKQGNAELAALFEESANVEANEHFAREADALGLVGTNQANLADAMAGELYENTQMYIAFANQAEKAGDAKVAALFRQIAEDEGDHYDHYRDAAEKLSAQKAAPAKP
jgi:rubrerythrin